MPRPPGHDTTRSLTRRGLLGLGALGAGALLGTTVSGCQEAVVTPLAPLESWDHAFVQVQVAPMDTDILLPDQTVVTAGRAHRGARTVLRDHSSRTMSGRSTAADAT